MSSDLDTPRQAKAALTLLYCDVQKTNILQELPWVENPETIPIILGNLFEGVMNITVRQGGDKYPTAISYQQASQVRVLPVPGGPWIRCRKSVAYEMATASTWLSF